MSIFALLSGATSASVGAADLVFADRFESRVFADCSDCPLMVLIPGGSFEQGSPFSEPESLNTERPVRAVDVPALAVSLTPVTFAQWNACVLDGGCTRSPSDAGWGRGDRPVIDVGWEDAQEYVGWLATKTSHEYRLLTESEWEYTARAGSIGRFNTGDCIDSEQANFNGTRPAHGCPDGFFRQQTSPVASFSRNALGLYGTHGNVWEWVEDCWNPNYAGAPLDGSAWLTGDCSRAVLRGGSWSDEGRWLRSAARHVDFRDGRFANVGFRIARSVSQ